MENATDEEGGKSHCFTTFQGWAAVFPGLFSYIWMYDIKNQTDYENNQHSGGRAGSYSGSRMQPEQR